ncbi:hypothetical protein CARUB_v10003933mg [Capsella rubella]|uniref:Uncharacterized protein n=1 Tax=Capsella rubella TaxID=81985 RepID=R0ET43_9BRAS|nr:hypothetical protein CARUB_v10003933mg [Capsella rubella]
MAKKAKVSSLSLKKNVTNNNNNSKMSVAMLTTTSASIRTHKSPINKGLLHNSILIQARGSVVAIVKLGVSLVTSRQ